MKTKHLYKIQVNSIGNTVESYKYSYGSTKDITIDVSKNGIAISLEMGSLYTVADVIEYRQPLIFSDAIKKAFLLYLLSFSKELKVKDVTIVIDEDIHSVDYSETQVIFSLINAGLVRDISKGFKSKSFLTNILQFTKSSQDERMAALYALVYSKTKEYEAEKFVYLWIAFNGVYGYVSKQAKNIIQTNLEKKSKASIREKNQIAYLLALDDYATDCVCKKDNDLIARHLIDIINKTDRTEFHKDFESSIKPLLVRAADRTPIEITEYGYLLGYFSYYFRCNIIHANRALPLFSFSNEYEIKCLKIINLLLEEYLDEKIPKLFDIEYNKYIKEKMKEVIYSTDLGKDDNFKSKKK